LRVRHFLRRLGRGRAVGIQAKNLGLGALFYDKCIASGAFWR